MGILFLPDYYPFFLILGSTFHWKLPLWKAMKAFKSAILAIIGKSQVLIQLDNLRRLPRLGYAIGPLWDLLAKPCLMVKVSKSQKQFFLKLQFPKMNGILVKILPYEARTEFCQIFCLFFGQWSLKKKCFWHLLTFRGAEMGLVAVLLSPRAMVYKLQLLIYLWQLYLQERKY